MRYVQETKRRLTGQTIGRRFMQGGSIARFYFRKILVAVVWRMTLGDKRRSQRSARKLLGSWYEQQWWQNQGDDS
jgi:hypothetical protein